MSVNGKSSLSDLKKRLKDLEGVVSERDRLEELLADTKNKLEKTDEKILREIVIRDGAEENIRQQIEGLETLLEYSAFAVVILDETGEITSCNQHFENLFRYGASELLGRGLERLTQGHGPAEAWVLEDARRVFEGETVHGSGRLYRKDGPLLEVEFFGVPLLVRNRVQKAFWIFRDISELIRANEALGRTERKYRQLYKESKRTEALYRSLLHSSADAIVTFDLNLRTQYVSPVFTQQFGWTEEELVGRPLPFVPPSEREKTRRILSDIIEKGTPCRGVETKRQTKDGRLLDVSISASRYDDHQGRPAGVLEIIRDISDKKSLEAQLLQAHKMEAVGTLAGGIAHDFNNILQAISGYAQILIMGRNPEDPDYNRLERIEKSARKAADLTKQLLVFSRKIESQLRPVDLNQEVRQIRKLLERTLPKMIRIDLQLSEKLRSMNGDPVQIEQVLMNLGVNAMDAMPEGGTLTFETLNIRLDEGFCGRNLGIKPGEYVRLLVSDTGTGMGEDVLEHIFEPFFTTKETGRGTGLGLSMVYGIVKNHGGHIQCMSERGKGACFEIFFPVLARKPPGNRPGSKGKEIRSGQGETILLVDDEKNVLDVVQDMMSRFGYKVLTAESGEDAIEIFERDKEGIDIIILDLSMPGMGGHKCLEILLKIDPGAKVIIASGYSVSKRAKEAMKSGAMGFIAKPYHYTDILENVRDVLDK